ncbi:MAG: hypothetical protein H0V04_03910, partial [Chloroflexi bacterium]|nr:hypothetical protein [Chloroflexota bacterium]
HMQRAADAAALAGAIHLPGNPGRAATVARAEAAKNGYTEGAAGVTISAVQDGSNPRRLNVAIRGPVGTYFARVFGMTSITVTVTAKAEFTLPVPMGSPQDYYGICQLAECTSATPPVCKSTQVVKAPGARGAGGFLASQGFWGAVITRGGQRSNGDAYSPANNGAWPNANFDAAGYDYQVVFPSGTTNGRVYLYDATFCAVGHGPSGSYLGTGDHWIGPGNTQVTTDFYLWNTMNTPYSKGDDVLVASSGTRFDNENQVDEGVKYKGDGRYSDGGYNGSTSADCKSHADHNKWYGLAQNLGAGTYRIQVTRSTPANSGTNAENMWGIQVVSNSAATPRVHGLGRMAAFANIDGGASLFYLAQVKAEYAGKTLEIRLFDPGDVGGDAFLRIKRPGGLAYTDAVFSYTADNGRNRHERVGHPDGGRRQQPVQRLVDHHQHPAGEHVRGGRRRPHPHRRDRTRLVEDRVRDHARRQRHDDLGGQHPRQPGTSRALIGARSLDGVARR